jgi:hypothetical protein
MFGMGNSRRLNQPQYPHFHFRHQPRPKSNDRFKRFSIIGRKSRIFKKCARFCTMSFFGIA